MAGWQRCSDTYAETIINGGTIESTYRAIRQFLNGVEAQNILTVNGGTIEGANKAIWMQDPSKNANTGKLTVGENAVINGNIYLTVTAGSTEWPVEVSIAAAAVNGEVLTSNVPAKYTLELNNGVYGIGERTAVAQVGETVYYTLQDAINAGGTVVLLTDIELEAPITVTGTVTLDLAGYSIEYTSTVQGEAMITNKGNLTINDSVGSGVINYDYVGAADSSHSKGNYTISNAGTLKVNGGEITIANLSVHAKYPINNNSTTGDAILVINGGHLYNYNTSAIRMFCNSTTYKNSVTINGGLIEGYCAIWVQNPGSKTVNANLTIAGGEIKTTAKAYVNGTADLEEVSSRIYFTIAADGGAWSADSSVAITGGTINENVDLSVDAPEAYTVEGTAEFNGRLVLPMVPVATVNGVPYGSLQDAINAAQNGETVVLLADIADSATIKIAGKSITLDLNGKAINGVCNADQSSLVYIENNASLIVKDSVGTGKIAYAQGASNVGWTIDVKGKFVLESGTIELTGSWSIGYAVEIRPNSWGTEYTCCNGLSSHDYRKWHRDTFPSDIRQQIPGSQKYRKQGRKWYLRAWGQAVPPSCG